MILINLSHPLTTEHQTVIETSTGQKITRLIERLVHFDAEQSFASQAATLVDDLALTPAEWQQSPLLVNLPSLNYAAVAVLAELHGRCGYFPPVIRLRQVQDSLPPRYEVAEVINLQKIRDTARTKR